jgi:hypothetical protein
MGFDPQVTGDLVAETHMDLGLVLVVSNTHGYGSESPMSRLVMVPRLQYSHHKRDISTQPLTTHLVLPQIFLGRKVPISDVNCNFHVLEGGGCAMFQISTRFSKFEQKFSNIYCIGDLHMS